MILKGLYTLKRIAQRLVADCAKYLMPIEAKATPAAVADYISGLPVSDYDQALLLATPDQQEALRQMVSDTISHHDGKEAGKAIVFIDGGSIGREKYQYNGALSYAKPQGSGSCYRLFSMCTGLLRADISNVDATNLDNCFNGCSSLTEVTNMHSSGSLAHCFRGCSSLVSIDMSNVDATNLDNCFNGCSSLTEVTNMHSSGSLHGCFIGCSSLTSIDLSNVDATNLDSCFYGCSSLTEVTNMHSSGSLYGCFRGCSSLVSIDMSNVDATNLDSCFYGCSSLTDVTNMHGSGPLNYCFRGCSSLVSIDMSNVDATNLDSCFYGCSSLTDVIGLHGSGSLARCFMKCSSLTSIDLSNVDATNLAECFNGCSSLTEITGLHGRLTSAATAFNNLHDMEIDGTDLYFNGSMSLTFIYCQRFYLTNAFKGQPTTMFNSGMPPMRGAMDISELDLSRCTEFRSAGMWNATTSIVEGKPEGRIDLSGIATRYQFTFGAGVEHLRYVDTPNNRSGFHMSRATNLDLESMLSWVDGLYDWAQNAGGYEYFSETVNQTVNGVVTPVTNVYNPTIYMSEAQQNAIGAAKIAEITAKGWRIS